MRHQLNEPGVEQDPRTDRVKDPIYDQRGLTLGGERLADAEADGDGNRSRETVRGSEEVGGPALGFGPGDGGDTAAETETLESLVEHQDLSCMRRRCFGVGDGFRGLLTT